MQEAIPQRVVRLVSPVNPMPVDAARPRGVGRKGTAALPKAAAVCDLIRPLSVPITPPWRTTADMGPGARDACPVSALLDNGSSHRSCDDGDLLALSPASIAHDLQ